MRVQQCGQIAKARAAGALVLGPAPLPVGVGPGRLAQILLMDANDAVSSPSPVEPGDDQAWGATDVEQRVVDRGQSGGRGEGQSVRLGSHEPRMPRVVPLQDVGGGSAPQRTAPPPVRESYEQELVLQSRERQLTVVVDAQGELVEGLDRVAQAVVAIGLDPVGLDVRLVRTDDQRPRDVAAVAAEQSERVVGRQPGLARQGLERLSFGQQTATERRGVLRLGLQGQRAGDHRTVAGPPVQRQRRVPAAQLVPVAAFQIGDVQIVEPYAEAFKPRHRPPAA